MSTHAAMRAPQYTSPASCAFLRPVQALHTASGISQAAVPGRAASTTQVLHRASRARTPSLLHSLSACLHTQHTAPCARIRLTTQPAPRNNSLPHAPPRRLALTPPAARSEKLQRAPLHAPRVSPLHSETFSFAPPPRLPGHSPQQ